MVVEVAFNFSVRAAIPSKNQGMWEVLGEVGDSFFFTEVDVRGCP